MVDLMAEMPFINDHDNLLNQRGDSGRGTRRCQNLIDWLSRILNIIGHTGSDRQDHPVLLLDTHGFHMFQSKNRDLLVLSLIHISEPTRLGMISYAVFCL